MSMEEEHLRELEAIANSLPADPFGMGRLRLLLGSLPSPTQPEVKSAREGLPDQAPGGSGIGQALSLTSNVLPGGESGAGLGIIPEIFYGQGNLVPNPVLDAPDDGVAIGLASTPTAKDWDADYDLTSGSVGTIDQNVFAFRGAESNAFSSSALSILINSDGTNAYDLDIFIEHPNSVLLQDMPIIGHLVCAFRVWNGFTAMTAMTTITATVEIWDVTDGVMIASSSPFNLKTVTNETNRISCSIDAADINTAHPVRATLHIKAVKPAATGFDPFFLWGEPYLAFNATQAPGPFMPMLARHEVGALAYKGAGDSQYSLIVGDLQDVDPDIRFGSGSAATDTRIRRTAATELTIDNPSGGALGTLVVSTVKGRQVVSVVTVSIDADQNNWNPTGFHAAGLLRVSGLTANRTITGLDAGANGDVLVISNDSASSLILASDNASSSAANQFRFAAAANITIRTRGMLQLVYDNSRWRATQP